jgi:hypothetical protein
MNKGEKWRCADLACQAEIVVTHASALACTQSPLRFWFHDEKAVRKTDAAKGLGRRVANQRALFDG